MSGPEGRGLSKVQECSLEWVAELPLGKRKGLLSRDRVTKKVTRAV
jgi:hypothetical protein